MSERAKPAAEITLSPWSLMADGDVVRKIIAPGLPWDGNIIAQAGGPVTDKRGGKETVKWRYRFAYNWCAAARTWNAWHYASSLEDARALCDERVRLQTATELRVQMALRDAHATSQADAHTPTEPPAGWTLLPDVETGVALRADGLSLRPTRAPHTLRGMLTYTPGWSLFRPDDSSQRDPIQTTPGSLYDVMATVDKRWPLPSWASKPTTKEAE